VHAEIPWRATRAMLLARQGQAERAGELAGRAAEIAGGTDCLLLQAAAFEALAAAHGAAGETARAEEARARAIAAYEAKGATVLAARTAVGVIQPA
jgi:hypothetical protein